MTPRQLHRAARDLLASPREGAEHLWARAAAFLTRRALEGAMAEVLRRRLPGAAGASFSTQLLCLGRALEDPALARQTAYTWAALSAACHHHSYELPPTARELRRWWESVGEFLGRVGG